MTYCRKCVSMSKNEGSLRVNIIPNVKCWSGSIKMCACFCEWGKSADIKKTQLHGNVEVTL